MEKYKFIENLTSDVMFEAYGKDMKEVFENAAEALFSVICEIKDVEPKESAEYQFRGEDSKDLMFNWLAGLIGIVDVEQKFFSKFEVTKIEDTVVRAKCFGDTITPEKGGTVVKAVTYHKYNFEKTDYGYKTTITLDI